MPAPKLTPADVRAAAERLPRVRLAHLPTPLEELPRFAAKIGGGVRVFVKRDDCTGLVLGGNKARHNEFLLGDAVDQGLRHVRVGRRRAVEQLPPDRRGVREARPRMPALPQPAHHKTEPQGNLLLDYLVGANVEFTDAKIGPELNALLAAKADEFRRRGRKPYFWDPPRVVPLAAVSYAVCMAEIAEQLERWTGCSRPRSTSRRPGATGAGVALGKALLGLHLPGAAHLPDALAVAHPDAHRRRRERRRRADGPAAPA